MCPYIDLYGIEAGYRTAKLVWLTEMFLEVHKEVDQWQ